MLNITNLVEYIEKNKNIVFNNQLEREEMKNFLKKYNYMLTNLYFFVK